MDHTDESCRFLQGDPSFENSDYSLLLDNFVAVDGGNNSEGPIPMATEEKIGALGRRPGLGPWLVTSHIRQSRPQRTMAKGRRDPEAEKSSCPKSFGHHSSPPSRNSLRSNPTLPSSPSASDGKQKLAKVAKRWPPMASTWNSIGEDDASRSAFGSIGPLADVMDFDLSEKPTPADLVMAEVGAQSLKHARSPLHTAPSNTSGSTKTKPSPQKAPAGGQVCSPSPCMDDTPREACAGISLAFW